MWCAPVLKIICVYRRVGYHAMVPTEQIRWSGVHRYRGVFECAYRTDQSVGYRCIKFVRTDRSVGYRNCARIEHLTVQFGGVFTSQICLVVYPRNLVLVLLVPGENVEYFRLKTRQVLHLLAEGRVWASRILRALAGYRGPLLRVLLGLRYFEVRFSRSFLHSIYFNRVLAFGYRQYWQY